MSWNVTKHETFGILFENRLGDNNVSKRGYGGSPPEIFGNSGFKWCNFWALWTNLLGAKLTLLKDWKLPGAKKILPGAKPVCQVPNLALGTHFRNTAISCAHRAVTLLRVHSGKYLESWLSLVAGLWYRCKILQYWFQLQISMSLLNHVNGTKIEYKLHRNSIS